MINAHYQYLIGILKARNMKSVIKTKLLQLSVFTVLLYSCGGIKKFKDANFRPIEFAEKIEGVFNNMLEDSLKFHHNSFNGELNWRNKNRDTTSFESFEIKVLNEKLLKIDFYKNNKLSKSRLLRYRLRNNGFLKLRNQNFRISGIPYIFGECDIVKFELGLTKANNLILHGYREHAGGLLIVLSSGRAFSVNKIYNKIWK